MPQAPQTVEELQDMMKDTKKVQDLMNLLHWTTAQTPSAPKPMSDEEYIKLARMQGDEPSQFGESAEPELMDTQDRPLGGYGYITTKSEQPRFSSSGPKYKRISSQEREQTTSQMPSDTESIKRRKAVQDTTVAYTKGYFRTQARGDNA